MRLETYKYRNRWYATILVVLIPIMVIGISFNAAFRIADAYKWQMDKIQEKAASEDPGDTKTLSALGIYVDTENLSNEISDFMKHKSNTIETLDKENELYEVYLPTKASFSDNDYHVLRTFRITADILLVLAIICAGWTAWMFLYHIREGYKAKSNFRKIFLKSLAFQGIFQVVMGIVFLIRPVRSVLAEKVLGITKDAADLLPQIMGGDLMQVLMVLEFLICLVITGILFYVTWVCTKPIDVFNERRYFR